MSTVPNVNGALPPTQFEAPGERVAAGAPAVSEWEALLADRAGTDLPVMVVAAHPDDETVSAGGILLRLRNASLICVTDGSPAKLGDAWRAGCATRQQYTALRAGELRAAAAVAGIPGERIEMLGIADQTASLQMAEIAEQILRRIEQLRPALLITHPYEGGHPDHDAVALAVHAAQRLLRRHGGHCPEVIEMTSYHGARGEITTGQFLPASPGAILTIELSPEEQAIKRQMVSRHASQASMLAQFGLEREAFRAAPLYDFTQPPHDGRLWYEHFDWGMTGPRWRSLAAAVLREIGPASRGPVAPAAFGSAARL